MAHSNRVAMPLLQRVSRLPSSTSTLTWTSPRPWTSACATTKTTSPTQSWSMTRAKSSCCSGHGSHPHHTTATTNAASTSTSVTSTRAHSTESGGDGEKGKVSQRPGREFFDDLARKFKLDNKVVSKGMCAVIDFVSLVSASLPFTACLPSSLLDR